MAEDTALEGLASLRFAEAEGMLELAASTAPAHVPRWRGGRDHRHTHATTGRPGRHRSEAADEAIVAATLELLGELGYGGVTMAGVIERAGVSSRRCTAASRTRTISSRPLSLTLVPSALEIDTGSLAGDLKAFVAALSRSLVNQREEVMDTIANESKRNEPLRRVAARQVSRTAARDRARDPHAHAGSAVSLTPFPPTTSRSA